MGTSVNPPELNGAARPHEEISTYDDWLADFRSLFHVLEPAQDYAEYLQAEPVPECYAVSQQMARLLLNGGSNGLVYPSVRRPNHGCMACFRPALVYNPRPAERLEIHFIDTGANYRYQARVTSHSS